MQSYNVPPLDNRCTICFSQLKTPTTLVLLTKAKVMFWIKLSVITVTFCTDCVLVSLSTWIKLESSGQRKLQLRKWSHPTGLWASLWLTMWKGSAHGRWWYPWTIVLGTIKSRLSKPVSSASSWSLYQFLPQNSSLECQLWLSWMIVCD